MLARWWISAPRYAGRTVEAMLGSGCAWPLLVGTVGAVFVRDACGLWTFPSSCSCRASLTGERASSLLCDGPVRFHVDVEGSGFDVFAAGFDQERDRSDERYAALRLELDALPANGPSRTLFRIRRLFAGLYAERMVPDLLAIAGEWRPDLIVREVGEFGGCVAAEVLGIPHASVRSNTLLSTYSQRHLVSEEMTRLREVYGLPPDPDSAMLFRYLHLAFEPPRFHDPALPLAPTAHLLRPVPFSHSGTEEAPTWLANLPNRPTVSATLGTVFNSRTPACSRQSSTGFGTSRST